MCAVKILKLSAEVLNSMIMVKKTGKGQFLTRTRHLSDLGQIVSKKILGIKNKAYYFHKNAVKYYEFAVSKVSLALKPRSISCSSNQIRSQKEIFFK